MSPESGITDLKIDTLTKSVEKLTATIDRLDERMAETYARKDVIVPRIEAVESRQDRHASYWDWLIKLVVGAVILALLGLVLAQGGIA
jgi:outer membrane murein-binding lipoprotein Lpp